MEDLTMDGIPLHGMTSMELFQLQENALKQKMRNHITDPIHIHTLFSKYLEAQDDFSINIEWENVVESGDDGQQSGPSTCDTFEDMESLFDMDKLSIDDGQQSGPSTCDTFEDMESLFDMNKLNIDGQWPAPDDENFQSFVKRIPKEAINNLTYLKDKSIKTRSSFEASEKPIWIRSSKTRRKDDLKPLDDIVLQVRVYKPFETKSNTQSNFHPLPQQEFKVLGCQTLEKLKDVIDCPNLNMMCFNSEPTLTASKLKVPTAIELCKSSFFYFGDTFYSDMRHEDCKDNSEVIRQWANKDSSGEYYKSKTATMEDTKFSELTIRFGYPYVFQHLGNCEHLVVFVNAHLLMNYDVLKSQAYPIHAKLGIERRRMCMTCGLAPVEWITKGNPRVPHNPTFFCERCYISYNFIDGKKIEDFQAFYCGDKKTSSAGTNKHAAQAPEARKKKSDLFSMKEESAQTHIETKPAVLSSVYLPSHGYLIAPKNPSMDFLADGGPLHRRDCQGNLKDIEKMKSLLLLYPEALTRLQISSSQREELVTPFEDALDARHFKCLNLMLECDGGTFAKAALNSALTYLKSSDSDVRIHLRLLENLLKTGACPYEIDGNVLTTNWLFHALDDNNIDELRLFLENGAVTEDMEESSNGELLTLNDRQSPLIHALQYRNSEAFKLLLFHGASMNVYFNYYLYGIVRCSIPHYILYNYHNSETALKVIKIYRDFGGDVRIIDTWGYPFVHAAICEERHHVQQELNIIEAIRVMPELQHHRGFEHLLEALMNNPLGLGELCRLCIRSTMGRKYWCNIKSLEIPRELKQFLRYDIPLNYTQ